MQETAIQAAIQKKKGRRSMGKAKQLGAHQRDGSRNESGYQNILQTHPTQRTCRRRPTQRDGNRNESSAS